MKQSNCRDKMIDLVVEFGIVKMESGQSSGHKIYEWQKNNQINNKTKVKLLTEDYFEELTREVDSRGFKMKEGATPRTDAVQHTIPQLTVHSRRLERELIKAEEAIDRLNRVVDLLSRGDKYPV